MYYYLDIETNAVDLDDPATHEIITIQFQQLYPNGDSVFPIEILKAWESSEKAILECFFNETKFLEHLWFFVPVGYNLTYDLAVLYFRYKIVVGKK